MSEQGVSVPQSTIPQPEQVVVLFSGGQDSTTCLAWAISEYGKENIRTLGFDYGQRHQVEVQAAYDISAALEMPHPHYVMPVEVLKILSGAALTNPNIEVEAVASEESGNQFAYKHKLPSTFVPGRNMLFLTLAAAYGAHRGIYTLVTGVCQADDAGYPDCRESFILAAEAALAEALDEDIVVEAPLLKINKSGTWALADRYGVLDLVVNLTHTCYHGVHDDDHKHEWGYGCAECPACTERANGFREYMATKKSPTPL